VTTEQPTANTIRVLIAEGDPSDREILLRMLANEAGIEVMGLALDGHEAAQMAVQLKPDVVVMDEAMPDLSGLEATELIWLGAPQVATLLLARNGDPQILRRAMRAGAKDCLAKPVDATTLVEAVRAAYSVRQRRETPEFKAIMDPRLMPRVIAVTGAKGGVGKTTLATNLAAVLGQKFPGQVVLVDLYSQFGDVALMLDLRPKRTMADFVNIEDELDAQLLEGYLIPHDAGFKALVASTEPLQFNFITLKCMSKVLSLLKRSHRFVVIDVPPMLYDVSSYVLAHASTVLVVANLFDLTTLDDTRKLLRTLASGTVAREKVRLVLNRVARHNRLRAEEVEQSFDHGVAARIPNGGHIVVASVNEGRPVVLAHPDSPVSRSIRALAEDIARDTVGVNSHPSLARARLGWLTRAKIDRGGNL
jgi:pilus assembly protein CpaE